MLPLELLPGDRSQSPLARGNRGSAPWPAKPVRRAIVIGGGGAFANWRTNAELARAWGDYAIELEPIVGQWDWFFTGTFRNDRIAPEAQDKTWSLFTHRLNRKLFGKRYHRRGQGLSYIRGIEKHRNRQATHFHALVGGGARDLDWRFGKELWHELAGIARVYDYDPTKGAAYYIAKYVAKGGEIDVHLPHQLALATAARGRAVSDREGRAASR